MEEKKYKEPTLVEKEMFPQKLLAQDNVLTKSRYDFNVIEKRCLYIIIDTIRKDYDGKGNQRDLFNNLRIRLTQNQLADCSDLTNISKVFASLRSLRKKDIEIDNEQHMLSVSFINYVEYDKKTKLYEVEVSFKILPYLVNLTKNFTSFNLLTAITLKSKYSQRIYELCSMYKNKPNHMFFMPVDELIQLLKLPETYKRGNFLCGKVFDVAKKELRELFDLGQCDLFFDYSPKEKEGKKVTEWWFIIHTKETENYKEFIDAHKAEIQLKEIEQILKDYFPSDKKFRDRVLRIFVLDASKIEEVHTKFIAKIKKYPEEDLPKILRTVLWQDFKIK